MMSSLRRFGALAGAVALALGLSACTDLTSSSNTTSSASPTVSAREIDYSACATDDSAERGLSPVSRATISPSSPRERVLNPPTRSW